MALMVYMPTIMCSDVPPPPPPPPPHSPQWWQAGSTSTQQQTYTLKIYILFVVFVVVCFFNFAWKILHFQSSCTIKYITCTISEYSHNVDWDISKLHASTGNRKKIQNQGCTWSRSHWKHKRCGKYVNTSFAPRILITSNYQCIIGCSLPSTRHWNDVSFDVTCHLTWNAPSELTQDSGTSGCMIKSQPGQQLSASEWVCWTEHLAPWEHSQMGHCSPCSSNTTKKECTNHRKHLF